MNAMQTSTEKKSNKNNFQTKEENSLMDIALF